MLKRRRRSSISSASRRSSASSSSIVRSALRVTRNVATSSTTMPGNSVGRWAMMSSSAGMKRDSSTSNRRGKTVGTLTRAKRRSSMLGIGVGDHRGDAERELGDVRERVAGVDGERRQHREDALLVDLGHPLAVDGVEVVPADDGDARRRRARAPARRGTPASWRATSSWACSPIAASCWLAVRPSAVGSSTPAATWSFSAATRTWKNSSRFVVVMAQNLARSSSGIPCSLRQLQDPVVERQPAQLTVDEPVVHGAHDRWRTTAGAERERTAPCASRRRGGRGPTRSR